MASIPATRCSVHPSFRSSDGKDSARVEQIDLCRLFAEALAVFQRKEWLRAASLFEAINKSFADDGPSRFYRACSLKYAAATSAYDGPVVIHMDEK